jgi:hypothetical protein
MKKYEGKLNASNWTVIYAATLSSARVSASSTTVDHKKNWCEEGKTAALPQFFPPRTLKRRHSVAVTEPVEVSNLPRHKQLGNCSLFFAFGKNQQSFFASS